MSVFIDDLSRNIQIVVDDHTMYTNSEKQCLNYTFPLSSNDSSITDIIREMLDCMRDASVQERGCIALSSLAQTENNRAIIPQKGGIEAIACAMKQHPNNCNVQKEACGALRQLTNHNGTNRITIPSDGGIQLIITSMNKNINHVSLQEEACKALYNLACYDDNKRDIARYGGIHIIITAMKKNKIHAGMLKEAFRVLRILCYYNQENKSIISNCGGLSVIINGMNEHKSDRDVLIKGCKVLYNLAFHSTSKVLMVTCRILYIISNAMTQHIAFADLQREAYKLLYILASTEGVKTHFYINGRIGVLIKIMKKHANDSEVQVEAFKALRNLSQNDCEIKKLIIESNGISYILKSLEEYFDVPDVQKYGFSVLCNLLHSHSISERRVSIKNCIHIIFKSMKFNSKQISVQEEAFRALNHLMAKFSCGRELLKENPIQVILGTMNNFDDKSRLLNESCKCLCSLSVTKENQQAIINFCGIETIIHCMEKNIADVEFQTKACKLLHQLSIDNSKCHLTIVDSVKAITRTLDYHTNSEDIQMEGCRTLCNFIYQKHKMVVARHDGIRLIIYAMKNHISCAELQKQCCIALSRLSVNDHGKFERSEQGDFEISLGNTRSCSSYIGINVETCEALSNTMHGVPDLRTQIVKERGIESLASAMKQHLYFTSMQKEALRALKNILINNENRRTFSEQSGIELIINCIRHHFRDAELLLLACKVLNNLLLSQNERAESIIAQSNTVEMLNVIFRTHPDNVLLQKEVCRLFRKIPMNGEDSSEGGKSSIQAIRQAMIQNHKNPEMQRI